MKKTILMLLISLSLTLLCTAKTYAGWTGYTDLLSFNTYQVQVLVKVPPNPLKNNPDNCTVADNFFTLKEDHPKYDEIYSSLLAAKISDSQVSIQVTGCFLGRPNIVAIAVN